MAEDVAIAIFAYNRPQHLRKLLESLLGNPESVSIPVYAFSDGPRDPIDAASVAEVREIFEEFAQYFSIVRTFSKENQGLGQSIISGVSAVLSRFESVIVLEDDLVLSPHFLKFMLDGLRKYRYSKSVASIHGYFYPSSKRLPTTFFLPGADCWGWATWRRGWAHFNENADELQTELARRGLMDTLNYGSGTFFSNLLRDVAEGNSDSWAIRWHASSVLAGSLTLYPGRSLVQNAGNDGSGTNSIASGVFNVTPSTSPVPVTRKRIRSSRRALRIVKNFWKEDERPSLKDRLYSFAGRHTLLRHLRAIVQHSLTH